MEDLKKLMGKKKKDEPDKSHIEAKMKVLQELRDMMAQLMGDGMMKNHEEMRKVAVMAKDKPGLLEGLQKAEDIVEEMPNGEESPAELEEENEEEAY